MLVVLTDLNEQAVADSVLPALPLITLTWWWSPRSGTLQVLRWAPSADRRRRDVPPGHRVAGARGPATDHRQRLRAWGATVVGAAPGRLGVR